LHTLRLLARQPWEISKKSLITANMQSKTGFPSSHQLKSYVAPKRRAVLSADAGLLVDGGRPNVCVNMYVKDYPLDGARAWTGKQGGR